MVPIATPAGTRLAQEHYPDGIPAPAPITKALAPKTALSPVLMVALGLVLAAFLAYITRSP
nr:hypothetical protein [Variovorax paradoxus]